MDLREVEVGKWYWCACGGYSADRVRITCVGERTAVGDGRYHGVRYSASEIIGPVAEEDIPRSTGEALVEFCRLLGLDAALVWVVIGFLVAVFVL